MSEESEKKEPAEEVKEEKPKARVHRDPEIVFAD